MAGAPHSPLLVAARPSAPPLQLGRKVKITDGSGRETVGVVTHDISVDGSMLVIHLGEYHEGHVNFVGDFEHVAIDGFPEVFHMKKITLIAIESDE